MQVQGGISASGRNLCARRGAGSTLHFGKTTVARATSQSNVLRFAASETAAKRIDVPRSLEDPWEDAASHITVSEIKGYMEGFNSQPYEYDYYVDQDWVDGELPEELQGGTLFGAGPGLTRAYGSRVRHPDDGDGMLWSLAVAPRMAGAEGKGAAPGRAFFRNRFVRTRSFVAEQLAGRRLSRGFHDRGAPVSDGTMPGLPEPLAELLSRVRSAVEAANARPPGTPVPGSNK
ncbi:hypothetical protein FOA52_003193 [Chlamydomonas sp. UWO 241]|nr:hypothetical protein FOA52_003193 [Chlamydomonas sp. UWO 241]